MLRNATTSALSAPVRADRSEGARERRVDLLRRHQPVEEPVGDEESSYDYDSFYGFTGDGEEEDCDSQGGFYHGGATGIQMWMVLPS